MTSLGDLQSLFLSAQAGDREAFRVLYLKLSPLVFRFIRPRARSREEALDVLQEVFIEFWKGLAGFRYESDRALMALLYRIAIRRLFRFFRQWKSESSLEQFEDVLPDESSSVEGRSDMHDVARALAKVSMSDRAIITLRAVEGRPFAEISQLLQQSENALKVRYHRALIRLRKKFTHDA
jgi:RNA polymerase sigma-70 factor (ECF subfamily)